MSRCQGVCEGKLGNQGDFVTCGVCKSKYCYNCAGLKQNTWKTMNDVKRLAWRCKQRCRSQRSVSEVDDDKSEQDDKADDKSEKEEEEEEEESDVDLANEKDPETKQDRKMYRERMEKKMDLLLQKYDKQNEKLKEVLETLEHISKEQQDIKKENIAINEKLQKVEIRIQELENREEKNKVTEMKMKKIFQETKDREQYERNRNLEINQLDWPTNENIVQTIQEVANNFNITFAKEEIEAAHRIPNRNKEKPSTIIIQFKYRTSRDKWLEQRKKIVTNDNIYRNGNRRRVYINENMTPYTKSLFWKTRNFAKQNGYKYTWFRNGKIMMRKDEDTKEVKIVREEEDLLNLTEEQNS